MKESKNLSKTFGGIDISVDSPEQDHICFEIPVFASKKNQIDGKRLKLPSCIIGNLSFINIFNTVKEEMGGILHHTTPFT